MEDGTLVVPDLAFVGFIALDDESGLEISVEIAIVTAVYR